MKNAEVVFQIRFHLLFGTEFVGNLYDIVDECDCIDIYYIYNSLNSFQTE